MREKTLQRMQRHHSNLRRAIVAKHDAESPAC